MVAHEYSARHPTPPPPKLISNEATPPAGTVTGQEPHDGCSGGDGAGTLTADGTGSVVARSKLLATTRPPADTKLTSGYPVNVHDCEAVLVSEKYCDSVPAAPKADPTPSFNWAARQDETAAAVVELVGATAR